MSSLQEHYKQTAMNSRIIIAALLLLFSLGSTAQKKLFEEALQRGREPGKLYVMTNSKNTFLKQEDVEKYALSKGYVISKVTYKGYNRFGKSVQSVSTVAFIPRDEVSDYAYEALCKDPAIPMTRLSKKGSGYYYFNMQDAGGYFSHFLDDINRDRYFYLADNIAWSGELANGMLNGPGVGFADFGKGWYVWFKGTYDHGFPTGDIDYHWMTVVWSAALSDSSQQDKVSSHVGKMSDSAVSFLVNGCYGFADNNGNTLIKPIYQGVKSDFHNGIANVVIDKYEIRVNKQGGIVGLSENTHYSTDDLINIHNKYPELSSVTEAELMKFVKRPDANFDDMMKVESAVSGLKSQIAPLKQAYYHGDAVRLQAIYDNTVASAKNQQKDFSGSGFAKEFNERYRNHYKYDPEQKTPLCDQLFQYYEVCRNLGVKAETYYKPSKSYPKFDGSGYKQLERVDKAIKVCENNMNSPFSTFYAYAKPILSSNYAEIDNQVRIDRQRYNADVEAIQKAFRAKLKSINTSNIDNYVVKHDSDWSKGRFKDTDENHEDHIHYWFKDINPELDYEGTTFMVTIYETTRNGVRQYYQVGSNRYTTFNDALCGGFLGHYGEGWYNNIYK